MHNGDLSWWFSTDPKEKKLKNENRGIVNGCILNLDLFLRRRNLLRFSKGNHLIGFPLRFCVVFLAENSDVNKNFFISTIIHHFKDHKILKAARWVFLLSPNPVTGYIERNIYFCFLCWQYIFFNPIHWFSVKINFEVFNVFNPT